MIRSIYFPSKDTPPLRDLSHADLVSSLQNQNGLLWVSLEDLSDDEAHEILAGIFQFHPLAIEDCISVGYQTPKIDDFGSYIFLITHAISSNGLNSLENTQELDIFLGTNFLVTSFRAKHLNATEYLWDRIIRDDRMNRNGSDFLCHAILDHLVDEYFPVIDQMEEEIEEIEDVVLENPDPEILARILELKHNILFFRRLVAPQREVMNRLSRDEFEMIDAKSRIYYRDIYDHLVRIQDLSESLRDIIGGVLDIYLNSTSLRLNTIMKALTVVSTIFLPLTFVAGVYGMNFQYMPEIYWRGGYLFVWVIFALIVGGMLYYFKKKKWF
jgi:magnesium transporter